MLHHIMTAAVPEWQMQLPQLELIQYPSPCIRLLLIFLHNLCNCLIHTGPWSTFNMQYFLAETSIKILVRFLSCLKVDWLGSLPLPLNGPSDGHP